MIVASIYDLLLALQSTIYLFFLINRRSKEIKPEQVSLQAAAELTFKGKISNEKNQDKCNTFAWLLLSLACVSFN